VVQGFITKAVNFCNIHDRETAFQHAIAELLWQSGEQRRACLAMYKIKFLIFMFAQSVCVICARDAATRSGSPAAVVTGAMG
jgi:hypothetical protein